MNAEQKTAVRERATRALCNLYHNATLPWIKETYGRSEDYCNEWLRDAAEQEIHYLNGGGAYGSDYRKTLAADCNAGRYKSERARAYYVAKGMRARNVERADCGMLTGWRALEYAVMAAGGKVGGVARARLIALRRKYPDMARNDAQWERITEYGKLYTWGRGGRTLAPKDLIKQGGGGSFSIRDAYPDEMPIADALELIRVVESFNAYVASWCASVPEQWREHCAEENRAERAAKREARKAAKEEARRAILARAFC